jgi:hypothetical protein
VASTGKDVTLVNNRVTDLGISTVTGNLSVTSGGAITDSGALTVGGTSRFTTTAGNASITLDTATNALTGAIAFAPNGTGNVTLVNNTATDLAASTIGGNLSVTSAGNITDSGALYVAGTTSLTAGTDNDITLDNAANDFVGVVTVVSSNNTTLVDVNDITLGTVNAETSATITAGERILNDGNEDTKLTTPIANLVTQNGWIGELDNALDVDVTGTLFLSPGGKQDGIYLATLKGQSEKALKVVRGAKGIVMFNGKRLVFPPGKIEFSSDQQKLEYFAGTSQDTATLANEIDQYELTLDVFGDAVFAPYPDLINVAGKGVTPASGEDTQK